ncbi:cell wall surface anchor family protein [Streptococcus agalactiae]|uniref:cell wall surface anchor family protein n=1 Tax=Streptococcus agalactiae TaxID=1311 RepID=UPI0039795B4F
MKKVKALALFSTAILATASTGVYADEVISDGTTSPSTEQVDPTPAPSSSEVTLEVNRISQLHHHLLQQKLLKEVNEDLKQQKQNQRNQLQSLKSQQKHHQKRTGEVEVPTTDGGKATVVPDTSVPTNNPNITAETAQNAGASQVGTTSTVTGQVVRDVTRSNPVTLYNGASLVDIRDGLVTLSTGEKVAPEVVGVKSNADGTYTAKTIQGDTVTLPHTGEKIQLFYQL